MNTDLLHFLSLPTQDVRDVYAAAANRLNTLPTYVEKDLWVCVVLDALYNRLPKGHPKLLFKGGTSLSKGFGLVNRFSEDIDLVVHRDKLGFHGDRDPTNEGVISNNRRKRLFKELKAACSDYLLEDLRFALTKLIGTSLEGCRIVPDEDDANRLTLLVEYPTLYTNSETPYVSPRVKIEAGARSALEPHLTCTVNPYIGDELPDWSFKVDSIRVLAPERTFWEKLLILHGTYCGYRDDQRVPTDSNRLSRHYYDVAMILRTEVSASALSDLKLLDAVRGHNLIAFSQPWKRFEEAIPGSVRLVPQTALRKVIERDYAAMQSMILGDPPEFGWILEQLERAELVINQANNP
ncbi:MAG: nucleotidyl transferase AbiEii/AbiGii toxin family protein [Acidimicrobiia bacterium]|nr:nucleotidyl transferase AbiEii/AbiGii toxin family protein [Acidimicrobiia bacterium]